MNKKYLLIFIVCTLFLTIICSGQKVFADDGSDKFETGVVNTNGWTTVTLDQSYTNPVVIVFGQQGADIDMDVEASRPILRNVGSNSFDVIVINDQGETVTEDVGYIVMEEGHWTIDGVEVEAGTYSVSSASAQTIYFDTSFPGNTVVIDTLQEDTSQPVTSRYSENSMSSTGYTVYWEEFDSNNWGLGTITAGYIAVELGSSSNMFESGIYNECGADPGSSNWCSVSFSNSYTETPILFSNPVESSGGDPTVMGRQSLSTTGVDLRPTEDRVTDSEQNHAVNDLPWVVWTDIDANTAPTIPTNITCDGSDNCDISVDASVNLTGTGSTDEDGDTITYFIGAFLIDPSIIQNTTDISLATEGGGSGAEYNDTITALSPEARWILNSDGTDITGNGHDGTLGNAPDFVTSIIPVAPVPNCGDFDGSSDQYNVDDHPKINTGSGYLGYQKAISVWIEADTIDTTGNGRGIWTEGGTTNSLNMYVYDNGTSTNIYCNAVEGGGDPNDWVAYPISTGVTYHVGCMFDFNSEGAIHMYINGELVDSDTSLGVGTALSSHGNNNALGGVDQNTINHAGSQLSGNFEGRIADLVYWSDGSFITADDFADIYNAGLMGEAVNETNTTETIYTDIAKNHSTVNNITVTVEVDSYDPRASVNQGTNDPELWLEIYNGIEWISIGNFNLPATYTGTGLQTNNENFSLSTTDSEILTGWEEKLNQDIRIKGIYMDYNEPLQDEINYTNIWVIIDGTGWQEIGNHTNGSTFIWDTTDVAEQNCINLRTRAKDIDGSNTYTDYFTKGCCLNISHVSNNAPTISNIETISAVTLVAGSTKEINILFNATDADGTSDINENTANATVSKAGETSRHNYSCTKVSEQDNTIRFNCSIQMYFYDGDGTWNVNVSIQDNSEVWAIDDTTRTFTVNTLDDVDIDDTTINWNNVQASADDVEGDAITFTNKGNQNYVTIQVTGQDATDGSHTITAENFSIDTVSEATSGQDYLQDGNPITFDGSSLNKGASSTEVMYTYLDVPTLLAGTFTSVSDWQITFSTG